MPASMRTADSVHLTDWPTLDLPADAEQVRAAFQTVLEVREVANASLELARADKTIGKSQEAALLITAPADVVEVLAARGEQALAELLIVSRVELAQGAETAVELIAASGEKCPRCWNVRDLGTDPAHPEVCARCAAVLAGLGR